VFRQIYLRLRSAILSGTLLRATKLPSTRELAAQLGVSRSAVVSAFEQLLAEGYAFGKKGAGTYIASDLPEPFEAIHGRKKRTASVTKTVAPFHVRRPRRLQIAKHRVALRVHASRAAWSRNEALLTGLPIVTVDKSGGTAARPPRGLLRTNIALPSYLCSSQVPFETSVARLGQVVCLIDAKWVFSQGHLLPIVFRIPREPETLVRSDSDVECTKS